MKVCLKFQFVYAFWSLKLHECECIFKRDHKVVMRAKLDKNQWLVPIQLSNWLLFVRITKENVVYVDLINELVDVFGWNLKTWLAIIGVDKIVFLLSLSVPWFKCYDHCSFEWLNHMIEEVSTWKANNIISFYNYNHESEFTNF